MREEIEFRAWNKEKKIMVYENEDSSDDYWDGVCMSDVDMVNTRLNNNKYVWLQFTGLKDKNKIKIYRGDIIKINSCKYVVEFEDYKWIYKKPFGFMCCAHYDIEFGDKKYSVEVIGNIYKNPELLKEED